MVSLAVTGASSVLGRRVLALIQEHEPENPGARVAPHPVDLTTADLDAALGGAEVLVHLAVADRLDDDALAARVEVEGTRRLLTAAATGGVRRVVRVSTTAVYGAWPSNPLPITESAALRPNPGFGPACRAAEVERLLTEWAGTHPQATVTVLRSAPIMGAGVADLWTRVLVGRPPVRVRAAAPPVQVVHVDDLAAAVVLAAGQDLPGAYNVGADGWLALEDLDALLPRGFVPRLPAASLDRAMRGLRRFGLGDVPAGVIPYVTHPWVVATDRLAGTGWSAHHTNEEAVLETIDELTAVARSRTRPLLVLGAATVAGGVAAGVIRRRWRRGARRATRPTPG